MSQREVARRHEPSPRWIDILLDAGIAAEHWSNVGANDAPDAQIMAFAVSNDYVVLTNDLDFGRLLAATQAPLPSVLQLRSDDLSPDVIGTAVILALSQAEAELAQGALLTFDATKIRLSRLPLAKQRE